MLPPVLPALRRWQGYRLKVLRRSPGLGSMLVNNRGISSQRSSDRGLLLSCLGASHMGPQQFTRALVWQPLKTKCQMRILHHPRRVSSRPE